ncbi:MAG TPA: sugar ABC transporter substrate-binding protein [Armatimonadetes bacterium]|nr:sugar ABC transporter substrate-binding protein [Armatimonadota bacterium]
MVAGRLIQQRGRLARLTTTTPREGTAIDQAKQIVIAGVGKSMHAFWHEVEMGMRNAGKELNVRVEWYVPPKEDAQKQVQALESFIAKGVNGIAFAASNPDSVNNVIKRAIAQGIPCVAIDTDAPDSGRIAYIGTDNYKAGRVAGKEMAKVLDGKGKVVICTGSLTALNSIERMKGFKDVLKDYPNIEVLETFNDGEDKAKATQLAQMALLKYPDLTAFYGVYAINGPAAANAVKTAGKVGKVKIVCFDTTAEHMRLIKDGVITATIGQRPFKMGYESVHVLHRIITRGLKEVMRELPPSRKIDTGIDVVTKETVEDYRNKLIKLGIPVKGW